MNPRLFCREQAYHKALLLTYSFDPIFFEQVVLPDLWAGRSSDILVLGDQAQIDASTQAAVGQLWHLGRNYMLAGANHTGAFHPKVFLRLGPKDGIVMLGSGNVTSSGWGGNQELGTAWMVGPEHADKGGWLHPFLDSVLSWCGGELERDAVRRMKDVPWLSLTPVGLDTDGVVLHSRLGRSLAPALAQRWIGRRFEEVKILTGSTDESGAFLRWAHSTFGVEKATIALTPSSASFDTNKLADLPLKLRIIPAPADRAMHAKFYWFDGPDGSAAVMGSANCSAAAWLLAPEQGGNIETLVVYDQPSPDDFAGVLSVFAAPASDPVDVLLPRSANVNETDVNALVFRLKSLQWDSAGHRLQAEISPAPEDAPKKISEKTAINPNPVPIEDRFRDRLAAQISTFLTEMSSLAFAERCSATQMVQAVSFPLAVALRGQRRGWVKPEVAEQWALDVFSILFRGKASGSGGLLHTVEQRYVDNDQHSTFADVVGDGALWIVLVATLGSSNWQGVGTDIDKAVALREVFTAPQLLVSAMPERVAALIKRIRIDDARSYLADVAPTVTRLLEEIDSELRQVWEVELRQQGERGITHKVGDLLWREKVGWAICLEDVSSKAGQSVKVRLRGKEKNVMNGFYVNVSDLVGRNTLLGGKILQLRRAVATGMQKS